MTIKITVKNEEDPSHPCSVKVLTRDRDGKEPVVDVLYEVATLAPGESCDAYVTNSRALVVEELSNG